MRSELERLRAEVRSDREALAGWLDELATLDLDAHTDRSVLSQAAWALHHAYSAVEAILERTMRTVEGSLPDGADFHGAVLDASGLEIPGVRPPLLGRSTVTALHELRAFRHFVRHAYAVRLDADRLVDLQRRTSSLRPALEADLDRLDTWIAELAAALGSD